MASTNPASPSASPADRLKELQTELQNQEDTLTTQTKSRDALKSDVDSASKSIDEIEKAKAALDDGSLASLNDDKKNLDEYQKRVALGLDGMLGNKKKKVEAAIAVVQRAITTQKEKATTAKTEADDKAKAAETAQEDLVQKQKEYDKYKNLQKDLGGNIKKMQGFKSEIDKLDDAKPASMFVFLAELQDVLSQTKIPTKEEFAAKLTSLWTALDSARATARTKKVEAEAAKVKLNTEEAKLAALEKSRLDDRLKTAEAAFNEKSTTATSSEASGQSQGAEGEGGAG